MSLEEVARLMCLQNAVQHGGTCQPKGLMGRVMGNHPEFRDDPGAVMKALMAAGQTVNAMTLEDQQATLAAEAPELLETQKKERKTGLKPLPGDTDKVVLRFAPNPNGPLSFGHSRGVAIMAQYAQDYDGEVVLRFDDTDPQVKPPLYGPEVDGYQMILDDYTWLAGRAPDRVVKASDRIDEYHAHARTLIEKGGAYVCTCDAEAWRDMKNQGHPCPHRDIAPEALLEAWDGMVSGEYEQGTAVLRVKTDIQHKDPALRDWTAFRIVSAIHPREAMGEIDHHVCWPLLDFESAVEDHLQGVTHIIRGKDLMDSTRKQQFLYQHMEWDYPETLYWGRVSVHEFGKFSTSGMRKGIESGEYSGWDDPRLPTLQALRRRGFTAAALRRFWNDMGISEKDVAISMENVEAPNKAIIDEAPRYFFVPNPNTISVTGLENKIAKPLIHPSHDRGTRTIEATGTIHVPGDEKNNQLRLKDLGNIMIAGGTGFWTGEQLDRSMPIVQWLPLGAPKFTVLKPDGETLHEIQGFVEPAALEHIGKVVQFERFGFVTIESETQGVWLQQ